MRLFRFLHVRVRVLFDVATTIPPFTPCYQLITKFSLIFISGRQNENWPAFFLNDEISDPLKWKIDKYLYIFHSKLNQWSESNKTDSNIHLFYIKSEFFEKISGNLELCINHPTFFFKSTIHPNSYKIPKCL
jgi:hypothetical protein